ncbi:MAG TPA: hypothetical protein VGD98_03850 [Ktedonobacteraceae bacterium]
MSDTLTQARLARRLDGYMGDFRRRNPAREHPSRSEWESVWKTAETARMNNALTPELVDDVRVAVNKLF